MLFNSVEFLIFLPVTFVIYWLIKDQLKLQNWFLLAISYLFYGWWDYRFLGLIVFSSIVDYLLGNQLSKTVEQRKRQVYIATSLIVNLGLLGVFKYYDFFVLSFVDAFASVGISFTASTLNIVLPVGISFYTFQTLSYTIDIYRKKLEPSKDIVSFFAYVSFFPQLVAGPIERASNLLPQFYTKRQLSPALVSDGLRQILWGMFKKMVIADNCAIYVDSVFESYTDQSGATLLVAATLFAFQIYCDFSGYSDIAIGTAKLFGFKLMTNFRVPYLSRDIAEFWRRWHISLSTWFRDYIYIPLGGSRGSKIFKIRNVFVIFLVSGFWHGANWTFLFWGGINALLFLPLLLRETNRTYTNTVSQGSILPTIQELIQILTTFVLTVFVWIFFRADTIGTSFDYISNIFSKGLFTLPTIDKELMIAIISISVLMVIEWINRTKEHQLDISRFKPFIRHCVYFFLLALIFFLGKYNSSTFIYFQF